MLRRIFTFFGYVLGALILVCGTVGLVAYGQGYSINLRTGAIVHKGLILIGASPSLSTVTRTGSSLHKRTTYHATYLPGSYTFTVSKDGYRSWSKTLKVMAGQVTDARYVLLLPNTLVHATTATATAFNQSKVSRDHRHLAYVTPATDTLPASVWTIDLPDGNPTRRFELPVATATTPAEAIDSLAWSGDASRLLVFSHTGDGSQVVRVMNADGSAVQNLTTKYATPLAALQFAPTDSRLLFGLTTDGGLRRIDLGADTLSGVLASNVSQLSFANDSLLFVQTTELGKTLQSFAIHNPSDITQLLPSLPASPSYTINYSSYQGNDELIIIPSSTREATYYSGIFGSSPVSTVVARDVDNASFSPDGHFAALYSSTHLATFDTLLSSPTNIVTYEAASLGGTLSALSWADNNHLLMNLGSEELLSDFDGTNRQDLETMTATDLPFASSDQRTAYALVPASGGTQRLVSTVLH